MWRLSKAYAAHSFKKEVKMFFRKESYMFFKEKNHRGLCKSVSFAGTK
jgi:hypothetical protein